MDYLLPRRLNSRDLFSNRANKVKQKQEDCKRRKEEEFKGDEKTIPPRRRKIKDPGSTPPRNDGCDPGHEYPFLE